MLSKTCKIFTYLPRPASARKEMELLRIYDYYDGVLSSFHHCDNLISSNRSSLLLRYITLWPLQVPKMASWLLFAFSLTSLVSLLSDIFTSFTIFTRFTRFSNFTLNAANLKPALETVVYFLGSEFDCLLVYATNICQ